MADDATDFEAFYAASYRRVLGQIYLMCGDRAEAEDAVAEAFARAWQRWTQVRDADSPEAWVRRVSSRIAISGWRKTLNRMRAHQRAAGTDELDGLSADRIILVDALRRIPADQRRVVVLHHLLDMPVQEIVDEVGAAAGTVKMRLSRGRRALARALSDMQSPAIRR